MLSQLSRLIGLEGRPQANWICRGLINSGKPFFASQTYRSTSPPCFSPPDSPQPASLPNPVVTTTREGEQGRAEGRLFSSSYSQETTLGGSVCVSVLMCLCVSVCVHV